MPYNPDAGDVPAIIAAAEEHFLSVEGVTGVGLGDGAVGEDALVVYVIDSSVAEKLPTVFRNVPVVAVVTGTIEAQ